MSVAESFERLQQAFNPGAAAGVNKTIQLNITGDDAGVYVVKIQDQACQLIPGGVADPNLTLTTSDKDWLAISSGQLDAMNAFLSGKIKATGDMGLAMKIPQLFHLK